ncbi:hypothetical protein DU63_17110 [Methanosarcina mazei]|uniref:Uncharacterized protein n=1 Tax=Methanosarcina mazei TaxID=2209 RepID=A0A0F8JGD3_METMZ|nr:hypothetical protein DU63_17110 [Methanosarcina mazei]
MDINRFVKLQETPKCQLINEEAPIDETLVISNEFMKNLVKFISKGEVIYTAQSEEKINRP